MTDMMRKWLYRFSFYFSKRFYTSISFVIALLIISFFIEPLFNIATLALLCLCIALLIDAILVFVSGQPILAERQCVDRFSNGDENIVSINLTNRNNYKISVDLLDELPPQFPQMEKTVSVSLDAKANQTIQYNLKPTERGEYQFGLINLFLYSPLGLLIRHIKSGEEKTIAVYPSLIQMKRYQLLSTVTQSSEKGSRAVRKIGSSLEFEQIKEYIPGDDYRTVNWQATARRGNLMINTFMDERSQQVVCIIDKGRNMKMPFGGMTLLDYAINASLVLCNSILLKQDKAGLITYSKTVDQFVQPDKKNGHLSLLLENLYRQQTSFQDSNTEALYTIIRQKIKQRSLLVLFTNFESRYGLERQLPYLKKIASYHALLVVFFENTELSNWQQEPASNLEEVYTKTIAGKFLLEKKQMIKELQKAGIMALLTSPGQLTANVLNKYLEVKARQIM